MSKDFRGASGQEQSCELNRVKSPTEYATLCNVMQQFSVTGETKTYWKHTDIYNTLGLFLMCIMVRNNNLTYALYTSTIHWCQCKH